MKQHSDIERVLEVWMTDGPATIPDRVVDVVTTRIVVNRQRRAWPFFRRPTVTTPVKLVAALAAVLVVGGVGYSLLTRPGVGFPNSTPTPAPTVAPTPAPTAPPATPSARPDDGIAEVPVDDAILTPGRWRFHPFEDRPAFTVVADIPDGWRSFGQGGVTVVTGADAPSGIGIAFLRTDAIFSDPCHWDVDGFGNDDQPGDVPVGPTPRDLVDALAANESYVSSEPTEIEIGGHEGYMIEIQVPAEVDLQTCDRDLGRPTWYFLDAGLYAQGPENRWRLSVLDVGGERVIAVIVDYEATPAEDQQAALAIVESLEFNR